MDYTQKIREQMKRTGGVITNKELKTLHIPTIYLT